jgi:tetratricopeptide (TPR) repeat protein
VAARADLPANQLQPAADLTDSGLLPEAAAAPVDDCPTNLPAQPTPLIGREQEVAQVRALLSRDDMRLLTLTGPAGSGKTRLALQVAAEVLGTFRDGVYLVSLAPIRDPDLVIESIAATLGVREGGDLSLPALLKRHLREKHLLLVLDNFEHILDAAPLVAELLGAAPHLKVLVTSRACLQIYGEREFPVPLALPDPSRLPAIEGLTQYEAVRLFIELNLYRALGDTEGVAFALNNLGTQSLDQGDLASAMQRYTESLTLSQQCGHTRESAGTLHNMGEVARHQGDYERAAEQLRELIDAPRAPVEHKRHLDLVARTRAELSPEAFEGVWKDGRRMPLEEAIAYALNGDE